MIWLGFVAGRAFGWTRAREPLRRRDHRHLQHDDHRQGVRRAGHRGQLRELVVGVLIVEDLIAILLMAVLTAVAHAGRSCRPARWR